MDHLSKPWLLSLSYLLHKFTCCVYSLGMITWKFLGVETLQKQGTTSRRCGSVPVCMNTKTMKCPIPDTLAFRRVSSSFRQCVVNVFAQTLVVTHADISGIIPSPHHQHSFNTDQVHCYQYYIVCVKNLSVDCVFLNRFCNWLYQTFLYFVKSPTAVGCRLLLKGVIVEEQKLNMSTIHSIENLLTLVPISYGMALYLGAFP